MIICFDLDGTLVDTEDWVMNSVLKAFKKNNIKIKKRGIYDGWGLTIHDLIKKNFPKRKKEKIIEVARDFERIRKKTINQIKSYKNTKIVLRKLSKEYSLALLSNSPRWMINEILKQTKIDKKFFDIIIGGDEVRKPKPFPNEIKKAEKNLNKKAKFMIGDTKQDIITAKKAKIKSVIIKRKIISKKDLKEADFIIKDIKQLPIIIKEEQCRNI